MLKNVINEFLLNKIKNDFDQLAKLANFNSLEKIVKIHLAKEEFSIQNGCFTPTLKLARNVICKVYENEIEALYAWKENYLSLIQVFEKSFYDWNIWFWIIFVMIN